LHRLKVNNVVKGG